jgi:hypothetical protein
MEVHAHTHTPRKKWTHYLWEFLMLFLAVFCGFLAENQREHIVEKQRAKEYAKSLLVDLISDTTNINELVFMYEKLSKNLDSFIAIVNRGNIRSSPGGKIYYYGNSADMNYRGAFRTTTINQIKSSGSIRYFSRQVQKTISEYDQYVEEMSQRQNNEPVYNIETRKYIEKIFDNSVLEEFGRMMPELGEHVIDTSMTLEKFKEINYPLLSYDPVLLKEYANNCFARKRNWRNRNLGFILLKNIAIHLINDLKNEYHLK